MAKIITSSITITGPIKLDDLRWLVEETIGYSQDATVVIEAHKEYGPMEWDPAKITVSNEVKLHVE